MASSDKQLVQNMKGWMESPAFNGKPQGGTDKDQNLVKNMQGYMDHPAFGGSAQPQQVQMSGTDPNALAKDQAQQQNMVKGLQNVQQQLGNKEKVDRVNAKHEVSIQRSKDQREALKKKKEDAQVQKQQDQRAAAAAQKRSAEAAGPKGWDFKMMVCGPYGSLYSADLPAYLIAERGDPYDFISLDGGSCLDCIRKAADSGQLDKLIDPKWDAANPVPDDYTVNPNPPTHPFTGAVNPRNYFTPYGPKMNRIGYFRQYQLNGFAITSAQLTHTEGLIISSAEDRIEFVQETLNGPGEFWMPYKTKPIYATKKVIADIEENFKPPLWPANVWYYFVESAVGILNLNEEQVKYHTNNGGDLIKAGRAGPAWAKDIHKNTKLNIKTWEFQSGDVASSAFLVANSKKVGTDPNGNSVLYIGDTPGKNLDAMWDDVATLVGLGKLKTIFIPCAYLSTDPNKDETRHMTELTVVAELKILQDKIQAKVADKIIKVKVDDKSINVIVTGIRPEIYGDQSLNDQTLNRDETATKITSLERMMAQEAGRQGLTKFVFLYPESTDILYIGRESGLTIAKPASSDPGLFGDYRWRDIYNDYPALGPRDYGSGGSSSYFMEEAAVLFGAMMIVVCTLCFCLGIGFGYGLPVLKRLRANKRNKRLN